MNAAPRRKMRKPFSNLSRTGGTLHSVRGHCIICGRSDREVKLHPYTSHRDRLFCHRDRAVTEAMRTLGYNHNRGREATTVVAQRHLRLIEWLEGKLDAGNIARMAIYAHYGELPE